MEDTENTPAPEAAPQEVETQSEQVAPTEESADAPDETVADTPKPSEDWETRYKDLQSKFTKTAQEKAELERFAQQIGQQEPQQATPPTDPNSIFDADTAAGNQAIADQRADARYEARKAMEFQQKHADKLKNPLLARNVAGIIRESNARGIPIDQEVALAQAEKEIAEMSKPQLKEAQVEGVKQGQELAQKKGELGTVGEAGPRPKVSEDDLSAEEYAKQLNIPRGR